MAAFNRVILVGNLTRDPEARNLPSGQSVCRLGMATNRQFKNKQTGTLVQEVCYIDVDVWGPQADSCRQYLQKGRPVLVEGRLKFDSWEDQSGQKRSKHYIVAERVVFLSSMSSVETGFDVSSDEASLEGQGHVTGSMERDLFDQIGKVQNRVKAVKNTADKKMVSSSFGGGEIDFKDELPFEDNLPF